MYILKLFIFISVIFVGSNLNAQQNKKLKVLFLGNSYTYVNNLPQLIKDIASANGDTLIFDSNCPGGQALVGHYNDPITVTKLSSQSWNCVVLQAQSQEPALIPAPYYTNTLISAIKLDSMIKHYNSCSETVFFETWGRKNGDASNCVSLPPVCTYLGMQNRLRASYKLFADTTHSVFSPAGEAFRKSILLNPSLELYSLDESHPSLEGSYLTACVFYEVLFHKSVLSNTFTAGVSPVNSIFLQQIAHDVVGDSLSTWNIGKNSPYSPFKTSIISTLNYQFTGFSSTLSNKWYFGDGTTSTTSSPIHLYSSSQTYTVSHVVTFGCNKDSSVMILNALSTDANNLINEDHLFSIYPNPARDILHILSDSNLNYSIYNVFGMEVLKGEKSNHINIESLVDGVYLIELQDKGKVQSIRFIKSDN